MISGSPRSKADCRGPYTSLTLNIKAVKLWNDAASFPATSARPRSFAGPFSLLSLLALVRRSRCRAVLQRSIVVSLGAVGAGSAGGAISGAAHTGRAGRAGAGTLVGLGRPRDVGSRRSADAGGTGGSAAC
jgi:hypothetical protein